MIVIHFVPLTFLPLVDRASLGVGSVVDVWQRRSIQSVTLEFTSIILTSEQQPQSASPLLGARHGMTVI